MLDRDIYEGVEGMIDCIVNGTTPQMRLNGEVVNLLRKREMFIDVEKVECTMAFCLYMHGMELSNIEKFLIGVGYHKLSGIAHALFQSLNESFESVMENFDDEDYLMAMAESDYIYTLVLLDLFSELHDERLEDFKEYTRIYSLPKRFAEMELDLEIILKK